MATVADVEENFMAFSEKDLLRRPHALSDDHGEGVRRVVPVLSSGRRRILREGARYIVNVGSVGQPRDGDARACYVVYDARVNRVTTRRVAYNFRETQEKSEARPPSGISRGPS